MRWDITLMSMSCPRNVPDIWDMGHNPIGVVPYVPPCPVLKREIRMPDAEVSRRPDCVTIAQVVTLPGSWPSPSSVAVASSMMRERRRSRSLSMLPVNDDPQPFAGHESRPVRSDYRSGACSEGGIETFYIGDSE